MERPKSEKIYKKSCSVIPGGVNSPVRSFKSVALPPLIVESGEGAYITDCDGFKYIDYCGSWGPLIHGHAHPEVVKAAVERVKKGSSFGISTEVEGKIAQKVISFIPSIEKIRFVSSGTEATMSAIRLARGFTGRNYIVKFTGHYHGHADPFLVEAGSGLAQMNATSSSLGVPADVIAHTLCLPFNDFEKTLACLRDASKEIAAVILEPIAANMGVTPPKEGFLEMLREETKKRGILLIFDEVITGFRVAKGGAQELYKIKPDLTTLGKIVGGGFPAAAFGGRADVMEFLAPLGGVYQAGTLSGNPVAMEAGLKSLELLEAPNFYQELQKKTLQLTSPIKSFIKERNLNMTLQEIGSMFTLFFGATKIDSFEEGKKLNLALFQRFFKFLFERGIYFSPSQYEANFVSMAHTDKELSLTRDTILEFLSLI